MRRLLAFLLLPALLAAGCIKDGAPTTDEPAADDVAPAAAVDGGAEAGQAAPSPSPAPAQPTPQPKPAPAATTSASNASQPAPETPALAPRITVLNWSGVATGAGTGAAGAEYGVYTPFPTLDENGRGEFELPAGAKGIVVELVWTDAVADLDLNLLGPDAEFNTPSPDAVALDKGHRYAAAGGMPGQPDGRAVIVVTDADALNLTGAWSWNALPKAGANVAYTAYVSLFLDAAPEDGYTAVPEA